MKSKVDLAEFVTPQLLPHRMYFRTTGCASGVDYFIRLADAFSPKKVLIAIHGIARDPRRHIHLLSRQADQYGYTLIAPFFNVNDYPDFQRLGRLGLGRRADHALLSSVLHIHKYLPFNSKLKLFGFSGGAQFVHRFALAYPHLVETIAIASAGWYTELSSKLRFPFGTAPTKRLADLHFHPTDLCYMDTCMLVGSQDVERDANLRHSKELDRYQGKNRLTRARRWQKRLKKRSQRLGSQAEHACHVLDRVGHSFEEAVRIGHLDNIIFKFFSTRPSQ